MRFVVDGDKGRHLEVCGGRRKKNHIFTSVSKAREIMHLVASLRPSVRPSVNLLRFVVDGDKGRHLEVCGGRRKKSHIFTSISNKLHIRLVTRSQYYFLIHFQGEYLKHYSFTFYGRKLTYIIY